MLRTCRQVGGVPSLRFHSSRHYSSPAWVDYCVQFLRQRDRESFVCSLMLPRSHRMSAIAVRSFNAELASVRDSARIRQTALMRYQFWSSALTKIYEKSPSLPEHPIVQALAAVVAAKNPPRKWFSDLIDVRLEHIDDRQFASIRELEDFYHKLNGNVYFLLLKVCDVANVHADHAASHIAKAIGLVNALRALNADVQRNMHLLPMELMMHHQLSQEDLLRLASARQRSRMPSSTELISRLHDVTFDLASQANVHLEHARKLDLVGSRHEVRTAKLIFLPAAIADHYLKVLQRVDFDIFHPRIAQPYNALPLTCMWRKIRSQF